MLCFSQTNNRPERETEKEKGAGSQGPTPHRPLYRHTSVHHTRERKATERTPSKAKWKEERTAVYCSATMPMPPTLPHAHLMATHTPTPSHKTWWNPPSSPPLFVITDVVKITKRAPYATHARALATSLILCIVMQKSRSACALGSISSKSECSCQLFYSKITTVQILLLL